ncbi:hypothetical protein [Cellulophaga baltica]|uniref:hypothetical protein n=1 Tax=Cellulophaga baltica TaxID=76594 RepID=UPI002493D3F5|nr:hypothetical protein [Cellulophaga baltica]
MLNFWKSLAYTTKFSAIAFFVTAALGLLSMGALGAGLYYPVSFFFKAYPTLNHWSGDWVWPAMIFVGMFWAVGFIFGGLLWHYASKIIASKIVLRILYILVLWLWAGILWYSMISKNVAQL